MMLSLGEHGEWVPPILKTVASREEGIAECSPRSSATASTWRPSGEIERRRRSHLRLRVETILKERVVAAADRVLGVDREVERGHRRKIDPYRVADRLFAACSRAREKRGARRRRSPRRTARPGPTEERMA